MRVAMQAAIGNLRLDVKGGLGRLDPLDGADLTLKADHPDLGAMLKNLDLPPFAGGALSVDARLTDAGERTRLEVDAKLGDITAKLDGTLRTLGLAGSDIRFALAAGSLAKLQEGLPKIPASLSGGYAAARGKTELKDLRGRLGESAIAGRVSVVQSRRTRIEADLASPRLDLTPFLAQEPGDKGKAKQAPARKFVFGEERLPLDGLKGADARLRLAAGELRLGAGSLKDFESTLTVDGGRLALESRAKGGVDGTLDASLALVPERGGAAELKVSVSAKGLRTGFGAGKAIEPGQTPATGVEANLTAKGASARQMAAGANGRMLLTLGPGKVESSIIGVLGGDTLSELTDRLNPFSAKDPYTQLDCTVARVDIVDGQAAVEPVLMQSEKVTVRRRRHHRPPHGGTQAQLQHPPAHRGRHQPGDVHQPVHRTRRHPGQPEDRSQREGRGIGRRRRGDRRSHGAGAGSGGPPPRRDRSMQEDARRGDYDGEEVGDFR